MAGHEGRGAIFASLAANLGIAASKFVAYLLTGASSMLAEAVHSVVDSSNQVLLLIGGRRSKKQATKTHPFGYGRAHFLYAFIVSIVLFSLGGLFAIYEGVHKISHPEELEFPLIAYIVLAIAFTLEAFALRTVLKEAKSFKPSGQGWWQFIRQSKSINHVILMMEDSAALTGLVFATAGITLSLLTGNPVWDGIGTILIGVLLVGVAVILFVEVKSLLIGEAADEQTVEAMRQIVLGVSEVNQIIDLRTLYVGPLELFVSMKITVDHDDTADVVARTIDEVEARLRHAFPMIKLMYVEPDLFKTPEEHARVDREIAATIAAEQEQR